MKTVFKEGMKVYDQLNFPDKEGVVVEVINNERDGYFIGVSFQNEFYICYYTPEGCLNRSNIPTLSTKPYKIEFQGFEQKEPAKTYEEAVEWLKNNSKDRVIYADEAYINEEYERAFEALRKLTILRDFYNEAWKPNWNKCSTKYCIGQEGLDISAINQIFNSRVMCFETDEIRDKFLEEQRELLEIAKPLL